MGVTLNAKQADDHVAALTESNTYQLGRRLARAIERDRRGGTAEPDGFPRGGEKTGAAPGWQIENETDPNDTDFVPATAVELAAEVRMTKRSVDKHHQTCTAALRELENVVHSLDRLAGLLDGIDHAAGAVVGVDVEPGCSSCGRCNHFSPRFRGDLCQWCYGWVNDKDINPKRQQPPLGLIERRARGERITNRVIGEVLASRRVVA